MTDERPSLAFASDCDDPDVAALRLTGVTGRMALGEPYAFELKLASSTDQGLTTDSIDAWLSEPCRFSIDEQPVSGFIRELTLEPAVDNEIVSYRAVLAPRLCRLERVVRSRIFQNMSGPDVVQSVLTEHRLPFSPNLTTNYPVREYIVQYNESDFAFISRLLEHWGITYWFAQEEDGERIVFSDSNTAFVANETFPSLAFEARGAGKPSAGWIGPMRRTHRPQSQSITVRDYNWRAPFQASDTQAAVRQLQLTAGAPLDAATGYGDVVLYGEHVKDEIAGALFDGADLTGAHFDRDGLSAMSFVRCDLTGADFKSCDLRDCDFSGAILHRTDFSQSDLSGAVFGGAKGTGTMFKATRLNDADLTGAEFVHASFAGAILRRARGSRASLPDVDLTDTTLELADLDGVDLSTAKLVRTNLTQCSLVGVHAAGVDFRKTTLADADLSKATLAGANLSSVDVTQTNFAGADLRKTILSGARARRAVFAGADLSEADLTGADLVDTQYKKTLAIKATWKHAQLTRAVMEEADLRGSNFEHAALTHSLLAHANLDAANFANAKLNYADLHRVSDRGTIWDGADRTGAKATDERRSKAEDFVVGGTS